MLPINTRRKSISPSTSPTALGNHKALPQLLLPLNRDFLFNAMVKQKVVIRVSMNDQKSRSKAMKIAVGLSGVEAAGLQGQDKDQIQVTGEGFDAAVLTTLLRKSVGHADLVSVGPVEEKKDEKKEEPVTQPQVVWPYAGCVPHYPVYELRATNQYQDPYCSIM